MLMRTDPFRELDRFAQQVSGTAARPAVMPMDAWRERATDLRGKMLPCGHYPAEQVPDETYAELRTFFL